MLQTRSDWWPICSCGGYARIRLPGWGRSNTVIFQLHGGANGRGAISSTKYMGVMNKESRLCVALTWQCIYPLIPIIPGIPVYAVYRLAVEVPKSRNLCSAVAGALLTVPSMHALPGSPPAARRCTTRTPMHQSNTTGEIHRSQECRLTVSRRGGAVTGDYIPKRACVPGQGGTGGVSASCWHVLGCRKT